MSNRISNVKMRYSVLIRMSKYAKFGPNSNVKIGFRMSKCDIRPEFECQDRISNVKIRYSAPVRMSNFDIWPEFKCQNRISNVKNAIFGPIPYVKIEF